MLVRIKDMFLTKSYARPDTWDDVARLFVTKKKYINKIRTLIRRKSRSIEGIILKTLRLWLKTFGNRKPRFLNLLDLLDRPHGCYTSLIEELEENSEWVRTGTRRHLRRLGNRSHSLDDDSEPEDDPMPSEEDLNIVNPDRAISRCAVLIYKTVPFEDPPFYMTLHAQRIISQSLATDILINKWTDRNHKWNQLYAELLRLTPLQVTRFFRVLLYQTRIVPEETEREIKLKLSSR